MTLLQRLSVVCAGARSRSEAHCYRPCTSREAPSQITSLHTEYAERSTAQTGEVISGMLNA